VVVVEADLTPPVPATGQLDATWLGHSAVLLELAAARVVGDPVFSHVGRAGIVRRVGARLPVGPWDHPDLVVLSHMHHDHTDLPTLSRLRPARVVSPPGGGAWLRGKGMQVVAELSVGESYTTGGVTVVAVPANHDGQRRGGPRATAVGHLVSDGTRTVWLAGDTDLYDAMDQLPRWSPTGAVDLAMVPVWGWGPSIGEGHLNPVTAAEAVARCRARSAVPVHWGTLHPMLLRRWMTDRLTRPGEEFAAEVRRRGLDCDVAVLPVLGRVEIPWRPATD
jgi:L-ascorbate metabolism protein UlaG (beta-lactamase superfamily)